MSGMKTYLSGVLSVVVGMTLLLVGHYTPPPVVDPLISMGLIGAGLATMGLRGAYGAKTGR